MFDFIPRILIGILKNLFTPKSLPWEELSVSYRVWPLLDTDGIRMMAAPKYVTLAGITIWVHNFVSGFLQLGLKQKWMAVIKQQHIWHFRPTKVFQKVEVKSKLIAWDQRSSIRQCEFWSEGQLKARVILQVTILSQGKRVSTWEVLEKMGLGMVDSPPWPEVIESWKGHS